MKKLLIASALLVFFASCQEDEEPTTVESINLVKENKALSIMGYALGANQTLKLEIKRLEAEDLYKGRLNHMSFVDDKNSDFYFPLSDSLLLSLGLNGINAPYIIHNNQVVTDPNTIIEDIDAWLMAAPIASVGHNVSSDDTSWVIDVKVGMYIDTLVQPEVFMIETYMNADVVAKKFAGITPNVDLKFNTEKNLVANPDSTSLWDISIPNLDSTTMIVTKGNPIVNQHLTRSNSNPKNFFGTPLSSYWPFTGDFHNGDIIGTPDTRIRMHISKPEIDEFDYNQKVSFVTVLWMFNAMTGTYDYVNSYTSDKLY